MNQGRLGLYLLCVLGHLETKKRPNVSPTRFWFRPTLCT